MMGAYSMSRIHEANLTILKEMNRICRKYNIRYMLDTGTLIDAVRHKGFIPWNDDADMAFTRNQYETFMKVAPRELSDTMELLKPDSYKGGKAFYDFIPRVIYKKSECHEDSLEMQYYEGKLNHIWVDLFTLDKLPSFRAGAGFTRFLHGTVYGMAMRHRYKLDFGKYSMIHKIFVGGLVAVDHLVPVKLIFAMQKAAAPKDRRSKGSPRYYSNCQPGYLCVTVDRSCCDQVEDTDFEDTHLMIPKGWHQILIEVYRNYMEMPSEDEWVPIHSSQQVRIFDQNVPEQGADIHWGDDGREIDNIF